MCSALTFAKSSPGVDVVKRQLALQYLPAAFDPVTVPPDEVGDDVPWCPAAKGFQERFVIERRDASLERLDASIQRGDLVSDHAIPSTV